MNIGEWLDMNNKIEKDFAHLKKGDFVFIDGLFYIFLDVDLNQENFNYGEIEVIDYYFNIKRLAYKNNTHIKKLTSEEEKDYKNYCLKKIKYLYSKYGEVLEILKK